MSLTAAPTADDAGDLSHRPLPVQARHDAQPGTENTPTVQPADVFAPIARDSRPAKVAPSGSPLRLLPMPRQAESLRTRIAWTAIAIGVAALYLFALLSYWSPANPGVDQNGYLVGGRMFAQTGSTGLPQVTPYDFVGRMYVTAPSGVNYPKYPLGLPILYACAIWLEPVFGWNGYEVAQLLSPVSAALATLGVFMLVRRLTDSGFAGVMAMILLGTGQVMLTLADNPNSHAAGTCAVTWGTYFLIRFLETGALWRGIAAGFVLGYAYLIRYTDGLMVALLAVSLLYMTKWRMPGLKALGIGVLSIAATALIACLIAYFLGERIVAKWGWLSLLRESQPFVAPKIPGSDAHSWNPLSWMSAAYAWYAGNHFRMLLALCAVAAFVSLFVQVRAWWRLFVVAAAWLVPVLYQTVFNMVAMRAYTSYAGTNESTGFTREDFVRNWELMVRTLHDQALFFILPLGLLGMIAMVRRMPMIAFLLALWFFPSVLLYTSYYWAPDNWGVSYSRFILTQVPALIVAAGWLMGEVMRRQGRTAWRIGPIAKTLVAVLGVVVGVALLALTAWNYNAPRTQPLYWAIGVPGLLLLIAGSATLVGRFVTRDDDALAGQFRGWIPRLAVGVIVFIAAGIGVYRTTTGSEWGRLANSRANIETQARQNANLWGLGKQVRAAVPDGSVVFADGDRLHHLQWVGGWRMYFTDYFDMSRVKGMLNRRADDADPNPIDPNRVKFLNDEVYKNKDQTAVRNDMNNLIGDALAEGTRVFYAMTSSSGERFKRTLDRKRFETKRVGSYNDMPPPRSEEDLLPPSERPRIANRVGGGMRANQANALLAMGERQGWQIVEVLQIQPAVVSPATPPATRPTTKPTTRPK